MTLYHISEIPGIRFFEPRRAPERSGLEGEVVWAIDREHLPNYLLPRDCPRVTFRATEASSVKDVEQLAGPGNPKRVIAIESGWVERVLAQRLVCYEFDSQSFELHDKGAGYWVSRQRVAPQSEREILSPLVALLEEEIELRIMPSLWELREAVANSSLEFSIIRMRNASLPPEGFVSEYQVPE